MARSRNVAYRHRPLGPVGSAGFYGVRAGNPCPVRRNIRGQRWRELIQGQGRARQEQIHGGAPVLLADLGG